jgi:presenilin-like A22 family membrane protease
MLRFDCDRVDLVCLLLSFVFGLWYIVKKHWIANNIFGLSFAIKGIEMLSLNSVTNGCILLGGLFLYDVFWVFGTDVMVTVAKTFDAPIKCLLLSCLPFTPTPNFTSYHYSYLSYGLSGERSLGQQLCIVRAGRCCTAWNIYCLATKV